MAELLIKNLEPSLIKRLKLQAKQHHRSLQGAIIETAMQMSLKEVQQLSKKWHKRLSAYTFKDSAGELQEGRKR